MFKQLAFLVLVLIFRPIILLAAADNEVKGLEPVTLQLKWKPQFQFAGYYAALEHGFYEEEGLDVTIRPLTSGMDVVSQVASGEIDYAIGGAGVILHYANGLPIKALAAIFQHDALVFIAKQSSGIMSPYEMTGKRIMLDGENGDNAPLTALLLEAGLTKNKFTLVSQTYSNQSLISDEVDVMSAYITDQPYALREEGLQINIINPQDYGVDFYGDILYTSEHELTKHSGRAARFKRASLKGWKYALDNPDELIQLLKSKYSSPSTLERLQYEARETRRLILPDNIPLGTIEYVRLRRAAETYSKLGLAKPLSEDKLKNFVVDTTSTLQLSESEVEWLKANPVIRVGIDPAFAPYEWVNDKGEYVGISANYIQLIEERLNIQFEVIKDKPWHELIKMAKTGELDMFACIHFTQERNDYLGFTPAYVTNPRVIVNATRNGYIGSIEKLKGKTVAVENNYFTHDNLKRNYPDINLLVVDSTAQALAKVSTGEADAFIGDAAYANYAIKKANLLNLQFAGEAPGSSAYRFGIEKSKPELLSIINKALNSIEQSEREAIENTWMGISIKTGVQTKTIVQGSLVVVVLFLLLTYRQYRLNKLSLANQRAEEIAYNHQKKLLQFQKALYTLSSSSVFNLQEETMNNLVTVDAQQLDIARVSIWFLNEERSSMRCVALYNHGLTSNEPLELHCDDYPIYFKALSDTGFIIARDAVNNPLTKEFSEKYLLPLGITSIMDTPILIRGKLIGIVCHENIGRPKEWSIEELDFAKSIADQCARLELERESNEAKKNTLLSARVFSDTHEGIFIIDANTVIVDVNPALGEITGYSREEMVGQNPRILISGKQSPEFYQNMWQAISEHGHWQGEMWNRKKGGELYAALLTISVLKDDLDKVANYVGIFTDITSSKKQQEQLQLMAHYDVLTGLPNRVLFIDRFHQAIAHSKRSENQLAICFLDLDDFKPVNDNYGHDVGDKLLIEIAKRITANIRAEDTVSRQGGDEFALLFNDIESFAQCVQTLERIYDALAQPYIIDGTPHKITASTGVTLYPSDEGDIDTLLRHADQAMYQAKLEGKHRYHLFNPEHDQRTIQKHHQLEEIEHALENNEFQLYYQPKVNMISGKVFGAEALIRWIHPERGVIRPLDFLPVIEDTELEIKVGNWVIGQALQQLEIWNKQEIEIEISVNVASYHLLSETFFAELDATLSKHPAVDSRYLQLEILESSALGDLNAIRTIIETCKEALGLNVALDDFGTGYSSLTHLRSLPVDTIKIDQSFVQDILDDPSDYAIIDGIIGLADSFSRQVIAEGVETTSHGLILLTMGCEEAQGYGIARPMPADDFPQWLSNYSPNQEWQQYGNKYRTVKENSVQLWRLMTNHWKNHFINNIQSPPDDIEHWPILNSQYCHCGAWIKRAKQQQLFKLEGLNQLDEAHKLVHMIAQAQHLQYCDDDSDTSRNGLPELLAAIDDMNYALALCE